MRLNNYKLISDDYKSYFDHEVSNTAIYGEELVNYYFTPQGQYFNHNAS